MTGEVEILLKGKFKSNSSYSSFEPVDSIKKTLKNKNIAMKAAYYSFIAICHVVVDYLLVSSLLNWSLRQENPHFFVSSLLASFLSFAILLGASLVVWGLFTILAELFDVGYAKDLMMMDSFFVGFFIIMLNPIVLITELIFGLIIDDTLDDIALKVTKNGITYSKNCYKSNYDILIDWEKINFNPRFKVRVENDSQKLESIDFVLDEFVEPVRITTTRDIELLKNYWNYTPFDGIQEPVETYSTINFLENLKEELLPGALENYRQEKEAERRRRAEDKKGTKEEVKESHYSEINI